MYENVCVQVCGNNNARNPRHLRTALLCQDNWIRVRGVSIDAEHRVQFWGERINRELLTERTRLVISQSVIMFVVVFHVGEWFENQ